MNQPVVGTSLQSEDRSTDLRAKIVGILSDTANGCISELGYFPSLLRKFRELEQANGKWREENVRLFQDNRALAQYTRRQEEHIKTTPDSANRIAMLEEQVKTLSMQNVELRRMNEALVSSTNCNNPAHQRLLTDNQQFTSMHQTAIRTIHHLQQEVQPNAFHDNGKPPRSSHQNMALPGQDPRQHTPISQRVPHGYPPSHPPSVPMGAHQQIPGPTLFHQNASQPTTSPMPNLRMDYRPVSTAMQTDVVIPNISRSGPPQTSPISPVNSAHLPTTLRRDSTQARPPIVPNTQPYRRTSLTIQTGSSVPHRTSNSPQNPPLDNSQCLYGGTGWGGLLPNSPHSNRIPPSQSVPIPTAKSLPSHQLALSPAARDIYMQHTSPTSSVPHELLSPPDSVSIQTPNGSNQETLPAEVVSSPWIAFDQMKRERDDIGGDSLDTESAKKKIRLGEEDQVTEAAQVQIQDTSMDDESDQEIEVDSDGFRSIASCISELMENSTENPECYMCRLCDIRYKTGVISDAPKPLIGAGQEQLVQHLTTEHADAWETLRRDV